MLQDRVPGSHKTLGWTQLWGGNSPWETPGTPARISPSINGHTKYDNGQSTARHQGWDSYSPSVAAVQSAATPSGLTTHPSDAGGTEP